MMKKLTKPKEKIDPTLLRISLIFAFGALAPIFDSTMVNIAIQTMTRDMHTTISVMQWTITGYTLMMGITVPLAGWVTDRFNGKWIYSFSLVLFLIGSLFSAISTTITTLIIGRLIQGTGTGMLIPALSTLIMRAANGKNIGAVMSTVAIPTMIGPVLGPVLGAFIISNANWHMMFWVNVPLTLVGLLLIFFGVPTMPAINPKLKIDFLGIGLLAGFFAGMILGISNYSSSKSLFNQDDVLLEIVLGVLALLMYVLYAVIKPDKAIVPLNIFKYKNLNLTTILMMLTGITTNGPMMLLPLYFQGVRGQSVLSAGIIMGSQAIGMFFTRSQAGKLTDRIGPKWVVIVGLLITLLATMPFVWFDTSTAIWLLVSVLFIRGLGMGAMSVPLMTAAYIGMPKEKIGQATVITRILQSVGGAAGSAILSTIIVNVATSYPKKTPLLTVTNSYNIGFAWSCGFTLLMFIPAWFLSVKKSKNIKIEIN